MSNIEPTPKEIKPHANEEQQADAFLSANGGNVIKLPAIAPESVTCDVFMRTLTARCTKPGLVCLAHPLGNAWPAYEWKPGVAHPSASPYFCISTIKRPPVPGLDIDAEDEDGNPVPAPRISRSVPDCVETFVIVLDDISATTDDKEKGGKVHPDSIPLAPSYRLETSPGNFQYGYLLATPADPMDATALIDALRFATNADGSQKYSDNRGIAGANRVVRVPGSTNTKPGRNGWKAIMREWEPSRVFTLEQLAEGFAVTPMPASLPSHVQGADTDLCLESLEKLGMVRSARLNPRGFYDIQCPWAPHGSDPRDEAGYKPSKDHGVFHCHHSSCAGRNFGNLCEYLEEHDPEFAGKMAAKLKAEKVERNKSVKDAFGALPESEMGEGYQPPSKTEAEAVERREAAEIAVVPDFDSTWQTRDHTTKIKPRPPILLMSQFAVRGVVTTLVPRPNVGKSQFAVAQACAFACERPELIGEQEPFLRPGGVVFISNEDAIQIFNKKMDAFLLSNNMTDADLKHPLIVNKALGFAVVHRSAQGIIEVSPAMKALGLKIRSMRQDGLGDIALVTVDTQMASFSGVEENSNTDMGVAFSRLAEWADTHDIALQIIHHTTKDAWKNGSSGLASIRGASASGGSVRISYELQEPTPAEETSLPDAEKRTWFKAVLTKHYLMPPRKWTDRWFHKTEKLLQTEYDDGTEGPPDSLPVAKFSSKGPKLGIDTGDDDLVFRAVSALIKREAESNLPVAAPNGNGDRACKLFADALGVDTAGGRQMQTALERRGFTEAREEKVEGKGRTRSVLGPTAAGHKFAEDYRAKLDDQGFQPTTEPSGGEAVSADAAGVPEAPEAEAVEAPKPQTAKRSKAVKPQPAEPPAVLDMGFGEIDFGTAAD